MGEPPICACGIPARMKTSWTAENPGKKFYSCAYYEVDNGGGGCGYFRWYDRSGCERCDRLVRHTRRLTRKVRELEAEMEEKKRKDRKLKFFLFVTSITLLCQWIWRG